MLCGMARATRPTCQVKARPRAAVPNAALRFGTAVRQSAHVSASRSPTLIGVFCTSADAAQIEVEEARMLVKAETQTESPTAAVEHWLTQFEKALDRKSTRLNS